MASGPITSWEIDGETVSDFMSLGSKITANGDCSHEIKRRLLLGRKVMTNLDNIFKSTWAPRGNHVGPPWKSPGPPGEITWALRGNHVGPPWKSRGPPGEITWAPRGNHVGPQGQSRGPPVEITWAPRGNHVGSQGKSRGPPGEIT